MQNTYSIKKYFTINDQGFSEQIIQKSRFIGYTKRVESEQEAQKFIQEIKKKHYDATHNCYAYMIGEHDGIQKSNDDGEPGGTAGVPILEVIKMRELKNTVIVVTRYFGGVKLGGGGLIRAYSSTASQVIDETGIIERKLIQELSIEIEYSFLDIIQNNINTSEVVIDNIIFEEFVTMEVFVDVDKEDLFRKWIINITNNQVKIDAKKIKFIDKPYK